MIPLSLYVHFPWCVRKCPYCDFNSHEARGGVPEGEYVDALIADLDAALPLAEGRAVQTAFIGGGTPSLISPAALGRLLSAVSRRLTFAQGAEITLEANPGAIEAAKFAAFRAAGVTRLSLGIQSFDDAKLAALGRIHSADEARRAAELALRHFERVNLDLMTGLPGQTLKEARRDVETAISFAPGHVSAYALTLEPNTPFHHAPPPLPDEDLAADMQEMAEAMLVAAGYEHYETSAFARPGQRCRHNLNYWRFGDYLGIGAGAHSKIGNRREARPRNPKDWLADPVARRWQPIAQEDLPGEFMMNALRLAEGFEPRLFEERTGLPLSVIEPALAVTRREGLMEEARMRPTVKGRRFLNRLIALFLPA
ncbi:MAG: radical SAM family heme chaperone HemW [Candidatus Nitricoxidivorans perseverans]|uniref:Heme chaperone HemW n=1 Tax=Candidatus Nitricoxidivorans perseverans TaxID=2975601 RepID=A0AA49FJ73_9PROT|nr:MAG: radical SAM family heme chaperone HemW [Candidatus Nitricoxidivorans perseverans]